jgi:biotin carboxylase
MRLLLILPTHTYQADAYMAAARKLGVELTVASEVDSTFSKPDYEGLLTLDLCDPHAAADVVEEFAKRHPVGAVFGVDDRTAVVAAHVAERLSLPYSPVAAVEAAGNKLCQRERLLAAGVRVPAFVVTDVSDVSPPSALRPPSYPVVLKPLTLSASRGVIRADNDEEFGAAVTTIREILAEVGERGERAKGDDGGRILVEQYVPGREFAVEGTVIDGRFSLYAVFEKPDALEGPYFEETIYLRPPRIGEAGEEAGKRVIGETVQDAVRALGLTHGPVHAEVRVNGDGVWLIELAARPIGGKCGRVLRFAEDGSVSLEELNLGLATGTTSQALCLAPEASGVMMIPVPHPGVLKTVEGVEAALAVPKVTDVMITIPVGATLRQLPYESRYLGFIFARAETSTEVEAAIREAHAELRFTIPD